MLKIKSKLIIERRRQMTLAMQMLKKEQREKGNAMTLIHRSLVQEKEDMRQFRTEMDLWRHMSIIESVKAISLLN